ncbi:hypothetical protein MJL48_34990, partial [Salmonella enterica subsp. enterica serovar Kentucky]|nr:hypothetical protein [Salmonella enterica subsp. enterica serovar Kentucky]
TGWSEQASRDAIQHSFNAWVKEFGTGNKEHQQIIEQCEAFLNTLTFDGKPVALAGSYPKNTPDALEAHMKMLLEKECSCLVV